MWHGQAFRGVLQPGKLKYVCTGQEALAQILDLSRRGSSGSLPGSYPLPVPQIGGGGYPGMVGGYEDPAGSGVHDLWMRSQRSDPDR